jgi:hypothetical protein
MAGETQALLLALMTGLGGVGLLLKNFLTELAKIKLEETSIRLEEVRQNNENEQRRVLKQEQYYEMLLQNVLIVAGEEKDRALAMQERMVRLCEQIVESDNAMKSELHDLAAAINLLHQDFKNTMRSTNFS